MSAGSIAAVSAVTEPRDADRFLPKEVRAWRTVIRWRC
ncbi:hypothetical protein HD596_003131 [Nonomuraea jabiensis]|uniref:Uncharacterized protein n=1 Tax=Nonomuraea jabiensis TaxID=882448 RepID=A0A7W9G356_9ACTN|nr:hypothetical protein [Nonomuraea jabiensis]